MIKLKVKDYCQECEDFEPDVYKTVVMAEDGRLDNQTVIYCQSRDKCVAIHKYLKDLMERNSQEKHTS